LGERAARCTGEFASKFKLNPVAKRGDNVSGRSEPFFSAHFSVAISLPLWNTEIEMRLLSDGRIRRTATEWKEILDRYRQVRSADRDILREGRDFTERFSFV
jgi:hypothetical protein